MNFTGSTGRVVRNAVIALVGVLAFRCGVALRARSGDPCRRAGFRREPLAADRAVRPIRLVRADPGGLRRPPRRATVASVPRPAPLAPAPATAAAPPAAPHPSAPLTGEGRDESQQPPPADNEFDLEG
jgi:hypothetical protein